MHYLCPICDEKSPRDFAHFLEHSNQHVIDSIRKAHPTWEREDGVCQKCIDYYQKVLKGEPVEEKKRGGKSSPQA